jgi:hypothetical protein
MRTALPLRTVVRRSTIAQPTRIGTKNAQTPKMDASMGMRIKFTNNSSPVSAVNPGLFFVPR